MTPGRVSVFNTLWFDSGYSRRQFMRLLEVFTRVDPRISAQCLVRLLMRQTTEAGFSGYDAPRAVFLRCPQAPDACHHGRYGPEGMLCVAVQKTADFPQLQFLEGRRFFLLRCGGRFPWSCCSADHRDSPVAPVHVVETLHLALCSLPRWQAHEAQHHGRYAQKDSYALGSGKYKVGIAGVRVVHAPCVQRQVPCCR